MDPAPPDTTKDEGQVLINAARQSKPPKYPADICQVLSNNTAKPPTIPKAPGEIVVDGKHTVKFIYVPYTMSLLPAVLHNHWLIRV